MVSEVGAAAGCPKELRPVSHPPYTISPPDILYIDAVRLIPKPPYRLESLEVVLLSVTDTLPNAPIMGQYVISPEGMLSLGFNYGAVRVGGLTLDQAQTAIRNHLGKILRNPQVTLALAQFRGIQQVRGQHLVRPDGTIGLGTYGSVYVAGMTLGQAKCVSERYLSHYLQDPQVAVDVLAYNSKVYYVIYDGAGFGQQIFRLPATGNETVLDAISQVQGLAAVSSKKRIWLARPAPDDLGCSQVLPVDWNAITQGAVTNTNYQVFPGDRIYVDSNCQLPDLLRQLPVDAAGSGGAYAGHHLAGSLHIPGGSRQRRLRHLAIEAARFRPGDRAASSRTIGIITTAVNFA